MERKNMSIFINKAIEKTKTNDLIWKPLPDRYRIKRLPSEPADKPYDSLSLNQLSIDDSYMTTYKNGHLLLLVYRDPISLYPVVPPDNCELSLRMQDETSKYSVEICNTIDYQMESSSIIRLYNLVVASCSTINSLIEDFLNS